MSTICTQDEADDMLKKWLSEAQVKPMPLRKMRISFKEKFPTGSYLNCDIGFEVDISQEDDPIAEMRRLKQLATTFHKQEYPHLYTDNQPDGEQWQTKKGVEVLTPSTHAREPKSTLEIMIDEMNKCTAISKKNRLGVEEGLLFYADKFPDNEQFRQAFDKKMEELKNK